MKAIPISQETETPKNSLYCRKRKLILIQNRSNNTEFMLIQKLAF